MEQGLKDDQGTPGDGSDKTPKRASRLSVGTSSSGPAWVQSRDHPHVEL